VADDFVRRTAITHLSVDQEQRNALETTITEWKRGCQIATNLAWGKCNTKSDVQPLAYDDVREQTDLGSQHAILATHQAAQCITGCIERKAKGKKATKPQFTAPTVKYDSRTMTVFDDETVSLSTTDKRVRVGLVLPEDEDGYQRQYLDSDEWNVTESTLTARDGEFYLHLGFRRYRNGEERNTAEDGTVLGVDLGVENIAVTSTARFFSGRKLTHDINHFEDVRGGLQRTGTRSAHRTLGQRSGRQERYSRDVLHQVANGILEEAIDYNCDVIAFEDLTDIREHIPYAQWQHWWAFRQLYSYVEYKTEEHGLLVRQVPPRGTSRRCSQVGCGFTVDENRPTRDHFRCKKCSHEANADYNAARNIGLRYIRRGHQSSRRTGDGQLALKSGTLTPKSGFTAYSDTSTLAV
jgi:IS605 OrfB family transposase